MTTEAITASNDLTADEANDLVWELINESRWRTLSEAIYASEPVALKVAQLVQYGDGDEFEDYGSDFARLVKKANHGGESIAIIDDYFIKDIMSMHWCDRDKATALYNKVEWKKEA